MLNLRTGLVLASLALSVALGLVLSRGSNSETSARARPLIGLSMDTLKEARWQRDRDRMLAKATALGADLLVQSANSDDARQIADVEALLTRKVDVLIVVPHDGTAMAKAVRMAHDAGIPVIAYDRMIRDADVDLYVSFDAVRVGELQAEWLVQHLPRGKIVQIYGAKSDDNAVLLKRGQDNVLRAHPDIKVVHEDWADDWKPEAAKKIVNAAIAQHHDIDAVLASNDGTAGGAIQALLEEGMAGKVLVTGQDAELVACQRIVAGTQAMTIYKPIETLAGLAIQDAVRLAKRGVVVAPKTVNNGKFDVPSVLVDSVAVTRENLDATVIRDAFHTHAEVYGK